jgi:hypothetical protein
MKPRRPIPRTRPKTRLRNSVLSSFLFTGSPRVLRLGLQQALQERPVYRSSETNLAVYHYHRHLLAVTVGQIWVAIHVHFGQAERIGLLSFQQDVSGKMAEMTAGARVKHDADVAQAAGACPANVKKPAEQSQYGGAHSQPVGLLLS